MFAVTGKDIDFFLGIVRQLEIFSNLCSFLTHTCDVHAHMCHMHAHKHITHTGKRERLRA
jgi:hypothetical protein